MPAEFKNDWTKPQFPKTNIDTTIGFGSTRNKTLNTKDFTMQKQENSYIEIIKKQLTNAGISDNINFSPTPKIDILTKSSTTDVIIGDVKVGEFQNLYLDGVPTLGNDKLVEGLLKEFGNKLVEKYNDPSLPIPSLTTNPTLLYADNAYAAILDKNPPNSQQNRADHCEIHLGQQVRDHGCNVK